MGIRVGEREEYDFILVVREGLSEEIAFDLTLA